MCLLAHWSLFEVREPLFLDEQAAIFFLSLLHSSVHVLRALDRAVHKGMHCTSPGWCAVEGHGNREADFLWIGIRGMLLGSSALESVQPLAT